MMNPYQSHQKFGSDFNLTVNSPITNCQFPTEQSVMYEPKVTETSNEVQITLVEEPERESRKKVGLGGQHGIASNTGIKSSGASTV